MRRSAVGGAVAAAVILAAVALAGPGAARADEAAAAAGSDSARTVEPASKGKAAAKGKTKKASKAAAKRWEEDAMPGTIPVKPAVQPQHVQVQHILIGFRGSVPGKNIQRSKEEAKKLAYELLERARKGEDFDALVRGYTDDSPPGIYGMSGNGVSPAAGEYPRNRMVPAFGNVGFNMSPGNVGIADFDDKTSPYGWHVIKRLK